MSSADKAERDHCEEVARGHSTGGCDHSAGHVKMDYWDFVRLLELERADARKKLLADVLGKLEAFR